MTIDWSDNTLRTLDELAATAFPAEARITKNTLKRRIREGTLSASRPGRQFLASYADVHEMIGRLQVKVARHVLKPAFQTAASERAERELARQRLDDVLEEAVRKGREQSRERVAREKLTLPSGVTEADLANRALDHALEDARKRRKTREAEKRPVKRKRIR